MRLYVGNLPFKASEGDVQDFFAAAGVAVDGVTVMRDKVSGEARGFAFVDINDPAAGEAAIRACHGRPMMGRELVVNEARPMTPDGGPRRGGGGERRGGGGYRDRQYRG
jgi:RNA recognition motif-containing protein